MKLEFEWIPVRWENKIHVLCFKGNGKWLILVFFDPSVHQVFCWCREEAEYEKLWSQRLFVVVQQNHITARLPWRWFILLPLVSTLTRSGLLLILESWHVLGLLRWNFQWWNNEQKYCYFGFFISLQLIGSEPAALYFVYTPQEGSSVLSR